jgi:hypothetical protein
MRDVVHAARFAMVSGGGSADAVGRSGDRVSNAEIVSVAIDLRVVKWTQISGPENALYKVGVVKRPARPFPRSRAAAAAGDSWLAV